MFVRYALHAHVARSDEPATVGGTLPPYENRTTSREGNNNYCTGCFCWEAVSPFFHMVALELHKFTPRRLFAFKHF